jgi:glycogen phosphorylase
MNMACHLDNDEIDPMAAFTASIRQHMRYSLGKKWENPSNRDLFMATALTVRDWMVDRMLATEERCQKVQAKRLYYLSMEYLIGRSLSNNLANLGLLEPCRESLLAMGVDLEEVRESEADAALGNGGLGRLAACFLDSLATLDMPGYGYGINYEYGLFKQEIDAGYQREKPDNWLAHGTPWQIERPDEACRIPVYGRLEQLPDHAGRITPHWVDAQILIGIPYDMPIVGYGGRTTNGLRLYSARSSHEFDMQIFNQGDYLKAVELKIGTEIISKVLYPSDSVRAGRELRLVQEYFLVGCALQDIVRHYLADHTTFDQFPAKVAIQLNDTHPALAVAEVMRLLLDEHHVPWQTAWEMTQATMGYTNHTLLPEAMEKWPISLLEYVLPRHMQIIYDINHQFLQHVTTVWPGDLARLQRMSLIEEGEQKQVRMAHLAMVGSHSVNGVAALHTELVKTSLVPDFYQLWPERFNNKTNGVTQRRWLLQANPLLADLVHRTIGDDWIMDLEKLSGLESYAGDAGFQREFMQIKRANKEQLAAVIKDTTQVSVAPDSLFDIQVKRIHEYKRQLLNVMHIVHEYLALVEDGREPTVPRTYIFAGKAAPGYWAAKQTIKLINNVGHVVNHDPKVMGLMKVVFIPDYRVSIAEKIIPAADVSEQISTAGKEASGTGNMKFAMNGALTVGTLDGANIEIMQEVGRENIFIFGLTPEEVRHMRDDFSYHPRDYYHRCPAVKRVMDALNSTMFCPFEPGLFTWIYQAIMDYGDEFFHLADMPSYLEVQEQVGREFNDTPTWATKAILNVARIGKFSSDRTVREYARDIWHIKST